MYVLIEIGVNGTIYPELVADTKKEIRTYLKDKGYYFSKTHGRYIDDRKGESSSIDYIIDEIDRL